MPEKAPWITYRPELRVLDCTIRDGGLINNHQFPDEFVRAVYEACIGAGMDYMEVGYKNSARLFPKDEFGPWKHCDESDLQRVFHDCDPEKTGLKLTAMADAGKCEWKTQIVPCDQSPLDMIRVAFYAHQVYEAVEMIQYATELGYETSANLMAVSSISENEIDAVLNAIKKTPTQIMVIVDSFGHMYREQVDILYAKYFEVMHDAGKEIGIHANNNMQLAFANTIEAIILGANLADSTMGGIGRGAGNCPTELLLGFLRNPKFRLRPVVKLLQEYIEPLRKNLVWGPLLPYNITGQLNRHPRAAIKFLGSDKKQQYLDFFDEIVTDI